MLEYTQIEALLNTVVLSMFTESSLRTMIRSPPFFGPEEGLEELDGDDPPQAASTAPDETVPMPRAPSWSIRRRLIRAWRRAAGISSFMRVPSWVRDRRGPPRGMSVRVSGYASRRSGPPQRRSGDDRPALDT